MILSNNDFAEEGLGKIIAGQNHQNILPTTMKPRSRWIDRNRLRTVTTAVALLCTVPVLHAPPESGDSPKNGELTEVVKVAFREIHDGWSCDEVILKDSLNAAFIQRCRQSLPNVAETQLNWTLLNLRKAGELDAKTTKRVSIRHDDYIHAAEIAARLMYDKYRLTTDGVMCDPQRRSEFDTAAQAVAPDVSA